MKIDAKEIQKNVDIVDIISNTVKLVEKGRNFVGQCPFHKPDEDGSLKVSRSKQMYKCYSCGAGGDLLNFLMRSGMTFMEGIRHIEDPNNNQGRQYGAEQLPAFTPKVNSWKHVFPAPQAARDIHHYQHGEPSAIWQYNTADGGVYGYACRFEFPNGKKMVLPYLFASDGKRSEWRWMGFDKPRAMYNLHMVSLFPKATIIVVEGEKVADAVNKELDPNKSFAVSWLGGADGVMSTDWTPLDGRNVILWPDHDTKQQYDTGPRKGEVKPWYEQAGNRAMLTIVDLIQQYAKIIRWVQVPEDYPEKWDAYDKDWKADELKTFVLDHIDTVPVVIRQPDIPKPKPEGPKNPPLPEAPKLVPVVEDLAIDRGEEQSATNNSDFRMLGFDNSENGTLVYYFFSYGAKKVVPLSPSKMTTSNLMMLAHLNWWEEKFPGKGSKFDNLAAQMYLIGNSHEKGIYSPSLVRGRGAWIDNGKIVVHTGDMLLVDQQPVPLRNFRSKYVYEIGERLGFGTSQPLSVKDASKIIEKAKWLKWDREISAYLLAGWSVISPFCGVLPWRPHIWVTGPAGSGKSWVNTYMLKKLLAETAVVVQSKTTEAAVRGILQNDARPVIFDEIDVDSHADKERVQSVMSLARASSSPEGAPIAKGTQGGGHRTHRNRACFAFFSIGVQLSKQADYSRFTMLSLSNPTNNAEAFEKFEIECRDLMTPEYVKALQSRTMGLLPIIIKNTRMFADAVASVIGDRRIGDQVGGMLAGAYSLVSSKEISYEDAIKWVKDRDWNEERGLELTKDEFQLFSKIMGTIVRVESSSGALDRSIGELILASCEKLDIYGLSAQSAADRLRRIGILVVANRILISNTADGIKDMIKGTSWDKNHNRILERIPGAERVEPRDYFPGGKARGVSLPLSMLMDSVEILEKPAPYEFKVDDIPDELPF